MPLTRSAIHRLHLEQSASPAPASLPVSAPPLDESISSTLVSDDRTRSASSSSSSSSSSTDSDSTDDGDDTDTPDSDPDPTAHLSALLARAKDAARTREQQRKAAQDERRGAAGDGLAGNDELVLFGDDDGDDDSDSDGDAQRRDRDDSATPRASTSRALPPSLARPLSRSHPLLSSLPSRRVAPSSSAAQLAQPRTGPISLAQDVGGVLTDSGATRVARKGAVVVDGEGRGKGKAREVEDRWGQAPLPQLSKKQLKAKQPHTAGAAWFDMPATPMTPALKRELDALRLASALDPKRFLRGGAKRDKVGEFFQVGHVVAPSTRATTMSSAPRAHKRSFVEELVDNEEAQAYARKKTKEVLAKTMSGRKRQRKGYKGAAGNGGGAGRK
ncbi:hypothetical protein JCM9279_005139 [Rhodotorula babjevae]